MLSLSSILIVALGLLVVLIFTEKKKREEYHNLSIYKDDVGVYKPIWTKYGTWRGMSGDNRFNYERMSTLPWSTPSLAHLPEAQWMKNRFPSELDYGGIPYELDKLD